MKIEERIEKIFEWEKTDCKNLQQRWKRIGKVIGIRRVGFC